MKKLRNLDLTQKTAIAIPILFALSYLTKLYVERFRFSSDFRWIYEYGSIGSLIVCFLTFLFSFANSILLLRDLRIKLLPKTLWFLLSASVFLLIMGFLIALDLL